MVEIEVKDSSRFIRRHMNKALRRSYLKALTEPITNNDDSYSRLEKFSVKNISTNTLKKIMVYASKKRNQFDVVDFAEGMSHEEIIASFREYGEEKKTHVLGGRGVFGQGLSDVLFSRDEGGWVHTIKDELYTLAQFKWQKKMEDGVLRERRIIRVPEPCRADKKIRQQYRIPKENGTLVSFKFKEAPFPSREELIQHLSQFFMLRLINSNSNREVTVHYFDENENDQMQSIRYEFPQGVLLGKLSTSLKYDNINITIEGELYRSDEPLPQGEAGEDRQGGLLVFDEERSVLDLTLFGYDNDPLAVRFWGRLNLNGAHQLIRKRLKERDEILAETRDGFVRTHTFYGKLKQIIDDWLKPFIDAERTRTVQKDSALTDETLRKQKEAFEMLNELHRKVNSDIVPLTPGTTTGGPKERPENGIEFSCKTATLKKGIRYSVQLRIDSRIIPSGTKIKIWSRNFVVKLRPKIIEVAPTAILPDDEIDSHRIILWSDTSGIITQIIANANDKKAELIVSIEDVKPVEPPEPPEMKEPLEFRPSLVHRKPGIEGRLHLFIDTERVPKVGLIILSCTNERIIMKVKEVSAEVGKQLSDKIYKVDINFIGYSEGQTGTITAVYEGLQAEAVIKITSFEGFGDLFRGWDYREVPMTIQAYFERETGLVILNSRHPVNKEYFGIDIIQAHKAVETLPQSQMLLATQILDVCLWFTYSEAYKNNKIEPIYPSYPWIDIQRYIEESKFDLGKIFLSKFIKLQYMQPIEGSRQEDLLPIA